MGTDMPYVIFKSLHFWQQTYTSCKITTILINKLE